MHSRQYCHLLMHLSVTVCKSFSHALLQIKNLQEAHLSRQYAASVFLIFDTVQLSLFVCPNCSAQHFVQTFRQSSEQQSKITTVVLNYYS